MLIKDILETHVITVHKSATWLEVLKLMEEHDTNGIFVTDEHGKYLGSITIADLISHAIPPYMREDPELAKSAPKGTFMKLCEARVHDKVSTFMNKARPFYDPHTKITEIVAKTLSNGSYRLPVVDSHGKLIGVVNRRHIRDAVSEHFKKS